MIVMVVTSLQFNSIIIDLHSGYESIYAMAPVV